MRDLEGQIGMQSGGGITGLVISQDMKDGAHPADGFRSLAFGYQLALIVQRPSWMNEGKVQNYWYLLYVVGVRMDRRAGSTVRDVHYHGLGLAGLVGDVGIDHDDRCAKGRAVRNPSSQEDLVPKHGHQQHGCHGWPPQLEPPCHPCPC